MSERKVVLLGELAKADSPFGEVVRRAGLQAAGFPEPESLTSLFRRDELAAVLFPAGMKGWEDLCIDLRRKPTLESLPIIAVVTSPWDEALGRLFMFSIDDYVTVDAPSGLRAKLTAILAGDPSRDTKRFVGRVVVADTDQPRRVLYGRLLRRRGFDVDFAIAADDVRALRTKAREAGEEVRLVMATADLPPSGGMAAWRSTWGEEDVESRVPWLVGKKGDDEAGASDEELASGGLALYNFQDPPENLFFHINELLSPPPANVRASVRLLYGAPATFRLHGSGLTVPAFVYNINRTGVFLRTLAPPPHGTEVDLTIRPPFGEGTACVEARVVWRKELHAPGPIVPCGMGLVFTRVPIADGAALAAGYEALLDATPGHAGESAEPPSPPGE